MELFADESSDDEDIAANVVTFCHSILRKRNLRVWTKDKMIQKAFQIEEIVNEDCDVVLNGDEKKVRRGGILIYLSLQSEAFSNVNLSNDWQEIKSSTFMKVYQRRYVLSEMKENIQEHDRIRQVVAIDEESAIKLLRKHGVVIIPKFIQKEMLERYAQNALNKFEGIRRAAIENHGIDFLGMGEGANFREIENREYFRFDVRLSLNENDNDLALEQKEKFNFVSRICRMAATPTEATPYIDGNFGRYNFNDSGPRSNRSPLPLGAAGCVLTFPGAADQALHADTPHIFDHISLPGHYFNLFLAAPQTVEDPQAGLTAFVLGSHRLDICSSLLSNSDDHHQQYDNVKSSRSVLHRLQPFLIRPRLHAGDAVIFDARILHFGLANTGNIPRPLLYFNFHEAWFREPKQWMTHLSVFSKVMT
uniref:Phytanoyl-CoA dioxygenase n=1 Tax=Aureoumbra lagunensis TaxID=44058 RepID=A0A7S3JQ71_9STRA|mmetsp:Transcript_16887/g.25419  ORF Transcript_16887/g.25419 Transcript_16887/m.25419 type:complete len:420 (+) Transcript_16887:145-1404(+)|eukprot:CAMPEP_0197316380 /NCGR_PEP_ID=MMETSP0891-20130614/42549_1 /TAXON_ID=44058 ORGANISM="Aureoumbra lagunensis, Strain CCMP1510" /NCGR_SAMPLE_ID=MMETSP0891 /ASSEMBLY_ACC=CAM_ASM_000534 /LENGTH=419 /DNA_ID=CAMNT_0042805825 /DNA_START=82 /DNA_END=1341 /DNA_ORIENTATION=-